MDVDAGSTDGDQIVALLELREGAATGLGTEAPREPERAGVDEGEQRERQGGSKRADQQREDERE